MPGLFDGAFSSGGLLPYDDPRLARALMPAGNFVDDPVRHSRHADATIAAAARRAPRKELSPLCCRTTCRMWRK